MTLGGGVIFDLGATELTLEYSWNQAEFFDNTQYFTGKIHF